MSIANHILKSNRTYFTKFLPGETEILYNSYFGISFPAHVIITTCFPSLSGVYLYSTVCGSIFLKKTKLLTYNIKKIYQLNGCYEIGNGTIHF